MDILEDGSEVEEIPDNYTGRVITSHNSHNVVLWYQQGDLHRTDGPAFKEVNGNEFWCYNGKLHRIGGSAWRWGDGEEEWWINNKRITRTSKIILICTH
jgi:hypothetical protein